MIVVSVSPGLERLIPKIRWWQREQLPFATALALTRTAQAVKTAEVAEMQRVFDRPKPYTLNSLYVRPATKVRLQATVKLKDDAAGGTPAAKYLGAEIAGGTRLQKRFERALILRGLMPANSYAVPGRGVRLDQYGNISAGTILQILSALGAGELTAGYMANRTERSARRLGRRRRDFFVGRPGGGRLPLGVWERIKSGSVTRVVPVLIFVRGPHYRARFGFEAVAQRTIDEQFPVQFARAWEQALATAI